MVARLGRLRLLTAGVAGFVLGIGGAKRLLVTAFAASAITTSGVSDSQQAILVIWYVAVATALVWGPVLLFLVVGGPIVTIMARSETALARRQPQLLEYGLLALAAILLLDAVGLLL
jgi:hypothetical protein